MHGNLSTASILTIISQCVRNIRIIGHTNFCSPAQLQNDTRASKIKIEIILACKIKTHRNLSISYNFSTCTQWSPSNADIVGITAARPEYRGVRISEASNIGVAMCTCTVECYKAVLLSSPLLYASDKG